MIFSICKTLYNNSGAELELSLKKWGVRHLLPRIFLAKVHGSGVHMRVIWRSRKSDEEGSNKGQIKSGGLTPGTPQQFEHCFGSTPCDINHRLFSILTRCSHKN